MLQLLISIFMLLPLSAHATTYVQHNYDVKLGLSANEAKPGDMVKVKLSYTTDSEMSGQQLHAPYNPEFLEFVPSKSSAGCEESTAQEIRCYRKEGEPERMTVSFIVIATPCEDIELPMRLEFWIEDYAGEVNTPPHMLTIKGTPGEECLAAANLGVSEEDVTMKTDKRRTTITYTIRNAGPDASNNVVMNFNYEYKNLVLRPMTALVDGKKVQVARGKRWCEKGYPFGCRQEISFSLGTIDSGKSHTASLTMVNRGQCTRGERMFLNTLSHRLHGAIEGDALETDSYDNYPYTVGEIPCS